MLKHSVARRRTRGRAAVTSAQEAPTDFAEAVEDEDDPEAEEGGQEYLTQVGDRQDERLNTAGAVANGAAQRQ